jgi:signal transduction histidine kinase
MIAMEDLSLHILDIAENSIRAGAEKIVIEIHEDIDADELIVRIEDNGEGMDAETLRNAANPFFTTKDGKRFGLGLSLLAQAAEDAGGAFTIDSQKGRGTRIKATFVLSHPDMKPMGDIAETIKTLVVSYPDRRFLFDYRSGDEHHHFDSRGE